MQCNKIDFTDFIRFYESLPKNNKDSINIPYAVFMRTSLVADFDNLKNTITYNYKLL